MAVKMCPRGTHPMTTENTGFTVRKGKRDAYCRACDRENQARRRAGEPAPEYTIKCSNAKCAKEFRTIRRRRFCTKKCQTDERWARVRAANRARREPRKLSPGPIFDYIDAHGGWEAFLLFYPHTQSVSSSRTEGAMTPGGMPGVVVELIPQEKRAYLADTQHLREAKKRGWIDYYKVDDLACRVFGVHPSVIYKELWWEVSAA